ncbi:MAG: 50S ribosomal protein L19e [Candidatus Nitrosocaldus sp.]|nr:50S ribosomal protein L19e [Candidatus Nitrosocaldus sp.]MDW8000256.1 50S ribosomal protein L19e [Candidatus Nitrosocaldus sp.]
MNLRNKRELAARALGVGANRIKFDPNYLEDVEDAITRADMRSLLTARTILIKGIKGTSRARARIRHEKEKMRGKGKGSKEGKKSAREGKKELWVTKVRAYRRYLKVLKDRKEISNKVFWSLYRKVKGGQVRSLAHLRMLVEEEKKQA